MLQRYCSRWFGRPSSSGRVRAARNRSVRPALEALEDRTLLSAGALDPTFGGSGIVITHAGIGTPSFEGARAIAIDHQGNIVVAGTAKIGTDYDFTVLRYHPDGTLDNSFGAGGKRTIDVAGGGHNDGAFGVAIDSQGRIVLAGYANNGAEDDFAVVRLTATGALDGTFNGTGMEKTAVATPLPGSSAAYAVAVDAQDRIVAAGYAKIGNDDDFAVVRYNVNGSLDTTFGGNGKRTVDMDGAGFDDLAYGVAIDSQGRIVLTGQVYNGTDSDIGIARLTPTGALDGTFNGTGKIITHVGNVSPSFDAAHGVAIDPQGNIVVAGTSKQGTDYDFTVLRYTAAGNPDSTFGNNGRRTIDVAGSGHDDGAYGVAIDASGHIVLGGYAYNGATNNFAFARLNSNGSTDASFGTGGKFVINTSSTGGNNQAYGIALDAIGRVVAAGYAANATDNDFATVRLTGDPAIATSLVFLQQPSNANVNAPLAPSVSVEVLDQFGRPMTSDNGRPITIGLGANPGGAALGGTLTVNDVNGIATFSNLSLTAPGMGDTLIVSSAGLAGATSLPFSITALMNNPPPPPPSPPPQAPKVHYYATGADAGGAPLVNVYNAATGALVTSFYGLPSSFTGGVRVAVADVNGDGTDDIICAAGPGAAPQITVYDGKTFQPFLSFYGLPVGFTGGCFVAAGDVNGDGFADIIVSADRGGGPQVTITSGKDGTMLASFYATAPTFTGGIRVACADLFGTGHADVIAAAGPGGGPQVTIFSGKTLSLLTAFYTLAPTFTGGLYVAGGDVRGIGEADIIVGAEKGGGPQVTIFDGRTDQAFTNFYALNPMFTGGVRVGTADSGTGPARLLTAAGPGGGPQVTIFDGVSAQALGNFFAYPPGFIGGVFVA
jgi:uncharacterized delta-60 repeat protein